MKNPKLKNPKIGILKRERERERERERKKERDRYRPVFMVKIRE